MDIVSSVVVYILLWWWVFFMTLPFGAKPPEIVEKGTCAVSPQKSASWEKMLITTVLASVVCGRSRDYSVWDILIPELGLSTFCQSRE